MDPFGDAFAAPANNSGDAGADFLTQQQNEMEALENQFGVTSEPADTTQQSGVPGKYHKKFCAVRFLCDFCH